MKKIKAKPKFTITRLNVKDVTLLSYTFRFRNFSLKTSKEKWKTYAFEQEQKIRSVAILKKNGKPIGYGTLLRHSHYSHFEKDNTPEISDVWINFRERGKGLGTRLIGYLERIARKENYTQIGIGVGLYQAYGPAQKLYYKLGYSPDGKGITCNYRNAIAGKRYCLDDDLILWLTKSFKNFKKK